MERYQNKYRIATSRLQNWDYGSNAAYFITICTYNRNCFFGEIADGILHINDTGKLAIQYWVEIPNHFPFIELGAFVIMPNHVHGILVVNKRDNGNDGGAAVVETRHCLVETRQCLVSTKSDTKSNTETPGKLRFQNQGKNTISSIIGSYKSIVTKQAHFINPDFEWQSRFYDHIIRDSNSFERIQHYIMNNPDKWRKDKFYL